MNRTLLPGALVALLVAIAAAGGWVLHGVFPTAGERTRVSVSPSVSAALVDSLQAGFVGVAEHVAPAVVNLGTIQKAGASRPPGPHRGGVDSFGQEFFKQFFDRGAAGARSE